MKPSADGSEWMIPAVRTLFRKNKLPLSAQNKSLAVSYTTWEKARQKQAGTWDHKTDHKWASLWVQRGSQQSWIAVYSVLSRCEQHDSILQFRGRSKGRNYALKTHHFSFEIRVHCTRSRPLEIVNQLLDINYSKGSICRNEQGYWESLQNSIQRLNRENLRIDTPSFGLWTDDIIKPLPALVWVYLLILASALSPGQRCRPSGQDGSRQSSGETLGCFWQTVLLNSRPNTQSSALSCFCTGHVGTLAAITRLIAEQKYPNQWLQRPVMLLNPEGQTERGKDSRFQLFKLLTD